MHLTKIMERLSSFPEQGICVYNADGQLERKTYPTVKADQTRRQSIKETLRWSTLEVHAVTAGAEGEREIGEL